MFKKRFSMMTVLVACLCAIVVTLGAIFYSMERITGDALGSLKFLKTLVLVREKFVEQPSDGKLFDGAATGLVEALDDPYSVYLDQQPSLFQRLSLSSLLSIVGIMAPR